MANRYFTSQFLFSFQGMGVMLQGNCVIDSGQSSGIRSLKGSGIKAISRSALGTYKIQLDDSYNRFLTGAAGFVESVTGNTAITALTPGNMYIIRSLGSSTQANWETAGVPSGVPAAVGLAFLAAATSSGSGTAFSPLSAGILSTQVLGDPNLSISNISDPHYFIQCFDAAGAVADPADNSVLGLQIMLRNSSIKEKGE